MEKNTLFYIYKTLKTEYLLKNTENYEDVWRDLLAIDWFAKNYTKKELEEYILGFIGKIDEENKKEIEKRKGEQ